jgi:hypothetical protein
VPADLGRVLWDWICDGLGWYGFDYGEDRRIRQVAAALRIPTTDGGAGVVDRLAMRCAADPGFALTVVDALPALYGPDRQRAAILSEVLDRTGCAYRVRPDRHGLQLRAAPAAADPGDFGRPGAIASP